MGITFDAHSGDLGLATKIFTPLEFEKVVPVVAEIFQGLVNLHRVKEAAQYYPYKYGFGFLNYDKEHVALSISHLKRQLPRDVQFYEVDGRALFEIRGASGGIVSNLICYLISAIDL